MLDAAEPERKYYFRSGYSLATGFQPEILDSATEQTQRTVAVLGLAWGGTSVVSAILDALGVYMGPSKDMKGSGTYENHEMRGSNRREEVERCNAEYDIWGWKNVPGWAVFSGLPDNIRNLHGIFVYRDAFAVAKRQKRSRPQHADVPMPELLTGALDEYRKLTEVMAQQKMRRMVVSYQHSIQRPVALVQGICIFLGLSPTWEQVVDALQRVSAGGGYHHHVVPTETKVQHLVKLCQQATQDATIGHRITNQLQDMGLME